MCCPKQRLDNFTLPSGTAGRAQAIITSPGPKFCQRCGKKLVITPVSTEGLNKFFRVTPCACQT